MFGVHLSDAGLICRRRRGAPNRSVCTRYGNPHRLMGRRTSYRMGVQSIRILALSAPQLPQRMAALTRTRVALPLGSRFGPMNLRGPLRCDGSGRGDALPKWSQTGRALRWRLLKTPLRGVDIISGASLARRKVNLSPVSRQNAVLAPHCKICVPLSKRGSLVTRRWREMDSNSRSLV